MEAERKSCHGCNIVFALAEHYVWHESKPYHEACKHRHERKERLRLFILRHCVANGLTVVPPTILTGGDPSP